MSNVLKALADAHARRIGRPYRQPPNSRVVYDADGVKLVRHEPEDFAARADQTLSGAGSAWARELGD